MKGLVYNIQRYSVHDGPGIRTIVFLKGCPLRCQWCANPEAQDPKRQIGYNSSKCIGFECLLCQRVCQNKAVFYPGSGAVELQFDRCIQCLKCSNVCPAKAITTYGEYRSVEDVIDDVEKDMPFYQNSNGGLTISGGEPLLQPDFTRELLIEAHKRGINTAIETCGYFSEWNMVSNVFEHVDYMLYDIKSLNGIKHKKYTGVSNELIIGNLKKIRKEFPDIKIKVRTPVIPGFNDSENDINAIAEFVSSLPQCEYELLKYHRFGIHKYMYIGKEYLMNDAIEISEDHFNHLKNVAMR